MSDKSQLDSLAERIARLLPSDVGVVREEFENNTRAILAAGIERLDLVPREEFDVQRAVLQRTREKLEALEARLAELEGKS